MSASERLDYLLDRGCLYAMKYDGLYLRSPMGNFYDVNVILGNGLADMSKPYRMTWYGVVYQ